jgi:sortase (surface protein transpeptidase)
VAGGVGLAVAMEPSPPPAPRHPVAARSTADISPIPAPSLSTSKKRQKPAKPLSQPKLLPGKVRVKIPSLAVDAPMVKLGLNADGSLQVPTDYATAGWWDGGPFPGDVGPAVVVGHVDSRAGPAVFFRLATLEPGATVVITRPDGNVARFAVTKVMEVSKDHFPTKLVYDPTPDAELRLVTCGGSFNSLTGHYVDNVIVFARLTSLSAA